MDAALFTRFQAGDERAFMAIVEKLHARTIAFARLFTHNCEAAEDVAQEVFVEAWRQRARIDSAAKLRPWLFTLTRRMAGREAGRHNRRAEVSLEDDALAGVEPPVDATQRHGLLDTQVRRELTRALAELSETDRELVTLRFFGGLAIKELSEHLGMPMGSVGVKLGRALEKLRHQLESRGLGIEDFLP